MFYIPPCADNNRHPVLHDIWRNPTTYFMMLVGNIPFFVVLLMHVREEIRQRDLQLVRNLAKNLEELKNEHH